MSLLTDLYRSTLDDEYHQAATRRRLSPDTRAADVQAPLRPGVLLRQPAVIFGVGLLVIGMLLATTAVEQRRDAPALAAERASLVDRIEAVTARATALRDEVASANASLAAVQENALQTTVQGEQVSAELDTLGLISGATAVSGPGLLVVVDNAPPGSEQADDTVSLGDGIVQDLDLQQLVNGLWEAGAEAISVDGIRVGARSSIRAAGDALFMDLHPLSAPYEVVAIGDPGDLGARFLDTYGAGWFQVLASAYGIQYDVETRDALEVPALSGTDLTWAEAYQGRET